ncbi:peptidoglycan bridge formation glycyltransferase FemA/FemB family protein [Candidatus Saccharibacteria bacterium]|nr:peptidoglycan bridge formation glycyltransferase FemA/FemB family protein [Candidatus Saccharibacteria bacterium]
MQENFRLVELSEKDFETFVNSRKPNNFLQSVEMFRRYKAAGREAYLLGLSDSRAGNEKTALEVAALVVSLGTSKGGKIFSAPGGPILDFSKKNAKELLESFLAAVKPFLKKKKGMTFQFSPNVVVKPGETAPLVKGTKLLGEYVQCKWISVLNLSNFSSEDELFHSFRKGTRYSIKYTDTRFHLKVRELSRDELKILKSLAEKAGEKHGFKDQSLSYYEEMFDAFGEKLKVLAAFYEETPVAAAMFVLYGDEVVYLYSGADPEYNKYAGSYALQWEMLKFALKSGFPRYNFYGVRPEPGNGVFEFKNGFRAEVEELWGTYILPLSPLGKLVVARKKFHKFGEVA